MEIFENTQDWADEFIAGWCKHLAGTGEVDWKSYRYLRNRRKITSPGVDPARSRLMLVSTAGAYLRNGQAPFAAADPMGDYSLRTFSPNTAHADLEYAHEHYDHTARTQDPRVNLPLEYLTEMVSDGALGALTDSVVSFAGYQPDATAVLLMTIPEILRLAEKEQADAALLVPV
jgi:Glycine/sarcosine/betaine reductase selenoprotein B (GRDB)